MARLLVKPPPMGTLQMWQVLKSPRVLHRSQMRWPLGHWNICLGGPIAWKHTGHSNSLSRVEELLPGVCPNPSKSFWAASIFFSTNFLFDSCSVSLDLRAICSWACILSASRSCQMRGSVSCWWSWVNLERSAFRSSTVFWSLALVSSFSWLTWSSYIVYFYVSVFVNSALSVWTKNMKNFIYQNKIRYFIPSSLK